MEKNKSIDGLSPRRSKKSATTSTKKKTPTKKSTVTKPIKTTKTTTKKQVVKKPTQKTVVKKKTTTKKTPVVEVKTSNEVVEDFLKPVQAFNFNEENGKLEEVKENDKKNKKMKKVKNVKSKKRKIITRIIIGILSLFLILGIVFIIWGNDIIAKITGGQGNVFDLVFQDEHYDPLKTDENGRTNILAFGTSGYNMEGEEKGGVHDGAQLTDSIMIISLDQKTGDIAMLSLPRDLKASPTCTATGKINEVYWCNNMEGNNEQAGADALVKEVSDILGIDFQYYAHVNWGSLVQIVDTLGGITVTVDEDIYDYYIFNSGETYNLNGEQALWLARIRHGTANGDFTRGASQQKILIGIKDRVQEKSLSITELLSLASTLGDNLRTNFSINELKTLAHLTSEFDFNNMRQISLIDPKNPLMTTGTINGISYVLPVGGVGNYTRLQAYIKKMFSSDPRTYEEPSILILNGTEEVGVATEEKNKLEKDGYTNIDVSDAPTSDYQNITLYALTEKPGTKKLLEDNYKTTASSADSLPAGIDNTYDFVIIIGNNS